MIPEKEWRLLLRSHQPVSEKLEAFGFRQTEDGWYWACPSMQETTRCRSSFWRMADRTIR